MSCKIKYRDACIACGKVFRNPASESVHRHSFPVLCKRNAQFRRFFDQIEAEKKAEGKKL